MSTHTYKRKNASNGMTQRTISGILRQVQYYVAGDSPEYHPSLNIIVQSTREIIIRKLNRTFFESKDTNENKHY